MLERVDIFSHREREDLMYNIYKKARSCGQHLTNIIKSFQTQTFEMRNLLKSQGMTKKKKKAVFTLNNKQLEAFFGLMIKKWPLSNDFEQHLNYLCRH